ncbi:F0F1 ATP synthase subunit B [Rhodobiaceae bacterium]|jgi:F-type H+-transporting ATPase subunit b|nr:F0F1 ATP synthase subunit B [Rhodobiaceae bacterium]
MFDATFFVAVSFLLFVVFVVWIGLPGSILNALDERSANIQKELDEARILHEEAQSLLAKEKRKLEKCDEEVKEILKKASDQAVLLAENSKKTLEEEIQRKQKQADLKISQARDEAIRDVKSKATDLSVIIAKEYLKENIDDKISSELVDKSIEDLKRNL